MPRLHPTAKGSMITVTDLRKTKPAAVIEGDWPVLPPEDASRGDF